MLNLYLMRKNELVARQWRVGEAYPFEGDAVPNATVWVDMFCPTVEEEAQVEKHFARDVPTRAEMEKLEIMSQLEAASEGIVLTVTLLTKADELWPETKTVTFMLTNNVFITVRYDELSACEKLKNALPVLAKEEVTPVKLLQGFVDISLNRIADVQAKLGLELDEISHGVFGSNRPASSAKTSSKEKAARNDLSEMLSQIGRSGEMVNNLHESIHSFVRLLSFLLAQEVLQKNERYQFNALMRDARSLDTHVGFLSNQVRFLLQATLGFVNVQQNAIIKIFSVVAVMFMPPTLIASIYGMNFEFMPELGSPLGYPLALVGMFISGLIPYLFFKRKGLL